MDDPATQERQFAARIWSRLAPDEHATVPLSVASEALAKLGLPLHLISLPTFSTELEFAGFVTLISALRAAVEADPERERLEEWFDVNCRRMDDHEGVELDLLVQLPAAMGYAPLQAADMDDYLQFFPSLGGLVSKENVLAGFLRARETLRGAETQPAAAAEEPTAPSPGATHQHEQASTLEMLRQQRHDAEAGAASLRAELEQLRAENVAAVKKLRAAEARLTDHEAEAALLRSRFEESAGALDQLQREHTLQKRELQSATDTVTQLRRDAERIAREAADAKAKEEAAATKTTLERARTEDASASLQKAQDEVLELMEEKGRLAELVEKLIQSNRRLEEVSRDDQMELKTARVQEAQLRQELDAALSAAAAAPLGSASPSSLAQELAGTASREDAAAADAGKASEADLKEELGKAQGLVAYYASEYTRASDAVVRVQTQLEKVSAALEEKRRANQLLTDSSLELTAQLRAIERDRMGLVSQLKDRKRQIAMLRETLDSYNTQPAYAFDVEPPPPASVSAAVAMSMSRRRTGWFASLFSCCRRPAASGNPAEETRYTRLL